MLVGMACWLVGVALTLFLCTESDALHENMRHGGSGEEREDTRDPPSNGGCLPPLCLGTCHSALCSLCSVLIVKGLDPYTSEETVSGVCGVVACGDRLAWPCARRHTCRKQAAIAGAWMKLVSSRSRKIAKTHS